MFPSGSTGPLLFLNVEGKQPGDEIAVAANAPPTLAVTATVTSITPLDSPQIIVNGDVVYTVAVTDRTRLAYSG